MWDDEREDEEEFNFFGDDSDSSDETSTGPNVSESNVDWIVSGSTRIIIQ